jgi:hypothetical protein
MSNLFFILVFTLILLIIIFCVIDFFFRFHPLAFDLFIIGFHGFLICRASDLMTQVTSFKS